MALWSLESNEPGCNTTHGRVESLVMFWGRFMAPNELCRDAGELEARGRATWIMSITKILLDRGLLTHEQLNEAVALNRAEGLRLDRAIIQLGYITERQLLEVMSEQLNLPLVTLSDKTIDPQA